MFFAHVFAVHYLFAADARNDVINYPTSIYLLIRLFSIYEMSLFFRINEIKLQFNYL